MFRIFNCFGFRPTVLAEKIDEVWKLDVKIGALMQGDCYRALHRTSNKAALISITRGVLSKEQRDSFYTFVKGLRANLDRDIAERIESFGVDGQGIGYVVASCGGAKRLDFDGSDVATLRSRFLSAVMRISSLHSRGHACGNLTPSCFVVDSREDVVFQGFLGGISLDTSDDVPREARCYQLPTIKDPTTSATVESRDVYAIALMGLVLFGAKFPADTLDVEKIDEYLATIREDAPVWVRSILEPIVRESGRGIYRNAQELVVAISLSEDAQDTSKSGSVERIPLEQLVQMTRVGAPRGLAYKFKKLTRSPMTRAAVGLGVLALIVGVGGAPLSRVWSTIAPSKTTNTEVAGRQIVSGVSAALGDSGYDALVKAVEKESDGGAVNGAWKAILQKAEEGGLNQTAQAVSAELKNSTNRSNRASAILAKVMQPGVSADERVRLVLEYSNHDRESAARIALALIKEFPEVKERYRDLLVEAGSRLVLPVGISSLNMLSTDALMLALDTSAVNPKESVESSRYSGASESELWWLLEHHAKKRTAGLFRVAAIFSSKVDVAWPNRIFIDVLRMAEPGSDAPFEALVRCARQASGSQDVAVFSAWFDPNSTKALYGVLLSSAEGEVINAALDALEAKPNRSELVISAISSIRSHQGAGVLNYSKLIGTLGLYENAPPASFKSAFDSTRQDPYAVEVAKAITISAPAPILRGALEAYGRVLNPSVLIPLLDNANREVRLEVIPYLRDLPLASAREQVKERYALEQDSEVKSLYEKELLAVW